MLHDVPSIGWRWPSRLSSHAGRLTGRAGARDTTLTQHSKHKGLMRGAETSTRDRWTGRKRLTVKSVRCRRRETRTRRVLLYVGKITPKRCVRGIACAAVSITNVKQAARSAAGPTSTVMFATQRNGYTSATSRILVSAYAYASYASHIYITHTSLCGPHLT